MSGGDMVIGGFPFFQDQDLGGRQARNDHVGRCP